MISKNGSGARGWGLKTLYMFAILSGVGSIINFFIIPEVCTSDSVTLTSQTKGRSFNELDEMYEDHIPPRRMKHYRTRVEVSGLKQHN